MKCEANFSLSSTSPYLYLKPNAAGSRGKASHTGNWGRASGSRERASHSGSRTFNRSDVNPAKELNKMATTYGTPEKSSLNEGVISCVEMRSDLSRDREESESKLKSLVRHIQEAHRCVLILIDKQELADTQKELAKLHLAQKDPSSSGGQIDERTSALSSAPKKGTETPSDRHNHHHKQVAPPQTSLPQQPYMVPPQPSFIPQPQMTANQTPQYLPATQNPQVNQQGPQQPGQSKTRPVVNYALLFWELITKSIRALEKVQVDKSNLDHETKLFINVDVNTTEKTMSIIDNGIGMTKADLEKELCTKDGTHGVLFSAFLAADKVVVTTKHNEDEQYVCEASRGDHCFKIDRDDSETSSLGSRGTKITLFLEDDHLGYLEECCLQGLVDTFFRYIDYDITIRKLSNIEI